jgi:succinate-acetate transporter protein
LEFFGNFGNFWKIVEILEIFGNFGNFWNFLEILEIFGNFGIFWKTDATNLRHKLNFRLFSLPFFTLLQNKMFIKAYNATFNQNIVFF